MNIIPNVFIDSGADKSRMDILSHLLNSRIVLVNGQVTRDQAQIVSASLLYLDSLSSDDIYMYIDSPGGSVYAGLTMYNTMKFLRSDVVTVNTGMAMSMGAFLLSAGAKGKRISLSESTTMFHRVSSGTEGNIQDQEVSLNESKRLDDRLSTLISGFIGKTKESYIEAIRRDLFLDANAALEFGAVDHVCSTRDDLSAALGGGK